MKATYLLLSLVIFMTVTFSVFGQEQPKTIKKISIHDIYIQTGMRSEHNAAGTLEDFYTLAPKSVLLNTDLSEYSQSKGFNYAINNMFSVNLGIQFSDKQKTTYKTNPLLRLGFSYFSGTTLTSNLRNEYRKPYDTLTSAQTGQTTYLDSVTTNEYRINYSSEQLRFDGSLIFRTNPDARWSLFAGIGISAGVSINANTDINYNKFTGIEPFTANDNLFTSYNYSSSDNRNNEQFRNKNNFGASVFTPMGVDFRIGKKREFWKQMHLFYELRPGINITSIPELRTITNANVQHGFGIRVSWN